MSGTLENRVVLNVGGMTCGHCVARVQKALEQSAGVAEAKVDLDSGTADIRLGEATDTSALIRTVEDAGYTASAT